MIRPSNPKKQNLRALTRFFPRLWGLNDVVTGRVVDHGRAQFLFPSHEALNLILRRGPWSFNEWMVTMEPWNPNISDQCPSSINFWVQIRDIPLQFLSSQMVSFIGETLGPVVEVDEIGSGGSSISGRLCIRWPLSQPLVFERPFQFGHKSATVSFRYEKLRNYCFRCHSLQHDIDECEVPEEDAAMGHQEPDIDHDNSPIRPLALQHNLSVTPSLQASPITAIASSGHLLAFPSSLKDPIDMQTATVMIDGRQIPVAELRSFYHTYTACADPTEAEARRRRMLLSLEHTRNAIIQEVTRPLGPNSYPNKKRRTDQATSSNTTDIRGAAGPVPPPVP